MLNLGSHLPGLGILICLEIFLGFSPNFQLQLSSIIFLLFFVFWGWNYGISSFSLLYKVIYWIDYTVPGYRYICLTSYFLKHHRLSNYKNISYYLIGLTDSVLRLYIIYEKELLVPICLEISDINWNDFPLMHSCLHILGMGVCMHFTMGDRLVLELWGRDVIGSESQENVGSDPFILLHF